MQPNGYPAPSYPSATPTPPATDPYAFLNQSSKPPSRLPSLFKNTASFKLRLLMVLIIALFLILVLYIVKSVLVVSPLNLASLETVLSEQQTLSSLATTGSQSASSQSYLNFSFTALASANSDQSSLIILLAHNNIKINPAQLAVQPGPVSQLTKAQQISTFDAVYGQVMSQQLQLYKTDLQSAYKLNQSLVIKKYLTTDFNHVQLLETMFNSSSG